MLTIQPGSLPPDGITLYGEVPCSDLDIPNEDRISAPNPLRFRLHVSLAGGVLVQGQARTVLRCRCDRCLTYFDHPLDLDRVCHFYKDMECDEIDLTEDIREDILLAFPQQSLCRPDCRGLCSNCGCNLNVRDCGCRGAPEPGRAWDVLDALDLPEKGTG